MPPARSPGQEGLPFYSDIAAAAIAATERGRASAVCKAIGIANDATHAVVHFKACYLVAERLQFVRLHQCAGRLALSVDGRRDVARLAIHLRGQIGSRQAVVAAALRNLALNTVAGLHDRCVCSSLRQRDLLANLANISLHLIAERA